MSINMIFFFSSVICSQNCSDHEIRDLYEMIGINPEFYTEEELNKLIFNSKIQFEQELEREKDQKTTKNIPDMHEKLRRAYNILSNNEKRRIYNFYGEIGLQERDNIYRSNDYFQFLNSPLSKKLFPLTVEWKVSNDSLVQHSFLFFRRVPCRCHRGGFWCNKCRGSSTIIEPFSLNFIGTNDNTIEIPDISDITEYANPGSIVFIFMVYQLTMACNNNNIIINIKINDNIKIDIKNNMVEYNNEY